MQLRIILAKGAGDLSRVAPFHRRDLRDVPTKKAKRRCTPPCITNRFEVNRDR